MSEGPWVEARRVKRRTELRTGPRKTRGSFMRL